MARNIDKKKTDIINPVHCSSCGNLISQEAAFCPSCGGPNKAVLKSASGTPLPYVKSKVTGGILALLVGGLGVHKFYCGDIGLGIVYLLFCWTFITAFVAFIAGIIFLTCSTDEEFTRRFCH